MHSNPELCGESMEESHEIILFNHIKVLEHIKNVDFGSLLISKLPSPIFPLPPPLIKIIIQVDEEGPRCLHYQKSSLVILM